MVGVSGVVVRPQAVAIILTARTEQRPQPRCAFFLLPAAQNGNVSPVSKNKAADVQGLCARVFATACIRAMVNVAAGIAAEMLDPGQPALSIIRSVKGAAC